MKPDDRIPQDIEAEMSLLGAMELGSDAIDAATEVLPRGSSEAFMHPGHRVIFDVLCDMRVNDTPVDLITLENELRRSGRLEYVGGREYLITLSESVPSTANAAYYASIVSAKWQLRRMYQLGLNLQSRACEPDATLEALTKLAGSELTRLVNAGAKHAVIEVSAVAADIIDKLHHGEADCGIPTGIGFIDNTIGGLRGGDLVIIAAARSVGKTALAVQILSRAVFVDGLPVCLFSMEMSARQVVRRILASKTGIHGNKFRGQPPMNAYDGEALRQLHIPPGWLIDDRSGVGPTDLRMRARHIHQQRGVNMIGIDYLQLCGRDQNFRGDKRAQIEDFCQSAKHVARELDVPVILLSQLSRAHLQEGRAPELYDLKESGGIENDADIVLLLWPQQQWSATNKRPVEYRLNLRMAKARNDDLATGTVDFHGPTQKFKDSTDLAIQERMEPIDEIDVEWYK